MRNCGRGVKRDWTRRNDLSADGKTQLVEHGRDLLFDDGFDGRLLVSLPGTQSRQFCR